MESKVTEIFGDMVFDETTMKARLPKETFKQLMKTIQGGEKLDPSVATVVANAMKDWAVEKGATHFTHWFQPLTGITAEKHDSFITPTSDGKIIMEFSGKELVQGEPDASSFPSGGLRATFEARGYTAWDPTSYAFIKDGTLCIPTAFCSYTGEALDKKTPLLRSMQAINKQALRVLHLFGNEDVTSVKTTVGPEQEYFLVDKSVYDKREDLIFTGRTLFGAKSPKGQELEDHYFGMIKPRVQAFMKDLNNELWKLGILAKTEHNEVAPAQHELAPIFSTTNIACDHNQLTMEIMRKVAAKHGMVCLLHEKPFAGVNGSGKHNNWSISTNTGKNLLDPGATPASNAQFLLFLCAVIKAVDEYQDLLRISVASAGNDHRLGANEAPPAIVSMFLGDELSEILQCLEEGKPYGIHEKQKMQIGVTVLPEFNKDTTDRNRTSPFAFTGNKFEFRMLGSSESIACANVFLNTAVAEELCQFADELEKSKDFQKDMQALVLKTIKEHKRIIFNGNGYDDAWVKEAEKRGLSNLKSTPEALVHILDEKNKKVLQKHGVYSESEIVSRFEIHNEGYSKVINIEAETMLDMAKKYILPAGSKFAGKLADTIASKKAVCDAADVTYETELLTKVSSLTSEIYKKVQQLEKDVRDVKELSGDASKTAFFYREHVFESMNELRISADELETIVPKELWPFPSYGDLLFSVR
ncbi:MAG: glutamine synthetase III [Treponema porcinum]|uniref:glutamine synthetase III family protein n=1 Tax=Treponema porcinum TaxID=261392 RepID=UPI0023554AED|nr:glutamine synthetase III [Treponema porcinum]MCI6179771.1 glutamine synthetase III [Treponema porcinum]MCI6721274.1 glutamine synthetase III [Treponema porcinum]MCI6816540.1 glutamine synthetase III [Treponema porcinum]MCI7079737.1 glutamine synthetase III [Treponema porcinum]MCI7533828.1 glutamine synthetase III [Treponema porcinum]